MQCKQTETGSIYAVQAERDKEYLRNASKETGSIYAVQAERERQYLRSASRKWQAVSTPCKQKETDIFYAVKKDKDVLIKDTLY